jgi:hypothetical protein
LFNTLFKPFGRAVKQTSDAPGSPTFVSWIHYVVRGWNQFPEGYSKTITQVQQITGRAWNKKAKEWEPTSTLIVGVRIMDKASGCVQEALGSADSGKQAWGGAIAEAESQAFRRAMANFGMGLEMYMDEDEFNRTQRALEAATGDGEPEAEQSSEAPASSGGEAETSDESVSPTPEPVAQDAQQPESEQQPEEPVEQPASERQREVLKVIGAQLDALAKTNHDEALALFVNKQRGVLAGGMTVKRAGVVISKFREKLVELNMADPTKSDG